MSVSEFDRHQLFRYFEDTMGPERAATMMEVLTPVNWTELATKTDIANMATKTDITELRGEFKHDLAQHTRLLFFGMLASQATLVGLVFAVVQFGSS